LLPLRQPLLLRPPSPLPLVLRVARCALRDASPTLVLRATSCIARRSVLPPLMLLLCRRRRALAAPHRARRARRPCPPPPHRCGDAGIGADQTTPAASPCPLVSPSTPSMPLTLPLDPRMLAHANFRSRSVTRYEPRRKRGVIAQVIGRQTPTPGSSSVAPPESRLSLRRTPLAAPCCGCHRRCHLRNRRPPGVDCSSSPQGAAQHRTALNAPRTAANRTVFTMWFAALQAAGNT
jgi:hypothetical protein